jgi:hypothetical protein
MDLCKRTFLKGSAWKCIWMDACVVSVVNEDKKEIVLLLLLRGIWLKP